MRGSTRPREHAAGIGDEVGIDEPERVELRGPGHGSEGDGAAEAERVLREIERAQGLPARSGGARANSQTPTSPSGFFSRSRWRIGAPPRSREARDVGELAHAQRELA